jgi:hypothetical protein
MKVRMNRVINIQDKCSELRQRFIQGNMSGSELLVIDRQRGYIFYTMRGGVNNGHDSVVFPSFLTG